MKDQPTAFVHKTPGTHFNTCYYPTGFWTYTVWLWPLAPDHTRSIWTRGSHYQFQFLPRMGRTTFVRDWPSGKVGSHVSLSTICLNSVGRHKCEQGQVLAVYLPAMYLGQGMAGLFLLNQHSFFILTGPNFLQETIHFVSLSFVITGWFGGGHRAPSKPVRQEMPSGALVNTRTPLSFLFLAGTV